MTACLGIHRRSTTPEVDSVRTARLARSRRPSRAALVLFCVALALCLQGCTLLDVPRPIGQGIGVTADDLPEVSRIEGDRVYSLIGPDRIPAIDEPTLVPASEAEFMADDELVLGVARDGVAHAYSLWHLDRHEIVNDWLGGEPIAATW